MIEEIKKNELQIFTSDEKEKIRVVWKGKSMEREPAAFLSPFFTDLLSRITKKDLCLEMDFTGLGYMNSSTITPIVQMLNEAREKKLAITVLYNKDKTWQEVSFSAMKFFEGSDPPIKILGV